jgi:hypothetical protein
LNDVNGCAADIGVIQGYYKTRYIPGSVKLLSDFEEGSSYNPRRQFYFVLFSGCSFCNESVPLTVATRAPSVLLLTLNSEVYNFSIQEWRNFNFYFLSK